MKNIIIRAPFSIRSGYNTLIETICVELYNLCYNVYPISINGNILNPVIKKLAKPLTENILAASELCILPIQADLNDYNVLYRIPKTKNRLIFTMWESTQLPMNIVDLLNSSCGVIVPNEWNKENFIIDGVTVPIIKCPLFVDTSIFTYKPHTENGMFTFGSGNADPRKRLDSVIRCFLQAFSPSIKNVKLKIKINSKDINKLTRFSDNRIEVNTETLSPSQLAEWYGSIDVFVSGASSEGWGFMQHEAMACGRSLIAANYSGLTEFFDATVGLPLKYNIVPAEWSWGYSNGFWSKFNDLDMINKMKYCVNNQQEIIDLGKKAADRAKLFNIPAFSKNLSKILSDFDF